MHKIILSSILLSFLIACSSSKNTTTSEPAAGPNIDRVKKDSPDYTIALYNEGKVLYEQKCAMCHGLKNPSSKTADEWEFTVARMVTKANKKSENISVSQKDLITKYLKVGSK